MSAPTADPPVTNFGPGLERDVPLPEPEEDGTSPRLELLRPGPGGVEQPRFRIYTVDQLEQLPPLAWLIDQHIPLGGFSALYGGPGSGKTFLSTAWALTIAADIAGEPTTWLRWSVRRGAVVYVAAEGGAGLRHRIRAYRDAHELVDEPYLYIVREPVNLLEATAALLDDVRRALSSWPTLFVFDTLARCLGGGDENGPETMGGAILAIDHIRHITGAAVLANHHTGRQGEMPRGHSSLDAAVDSLFFLKDDNGVRSLECKKQREAEEVGTQHLRLVPIGDSCIIEPLEGDAPAVLAAGHRKLLQAHREVSIDGETNSTTWLEVSGLSKATYHRSLKRLIEGGYVLKRGRKYALTALGEANVSQVSP